jgi:hypothetical protein
MNYYHSLRLRKEAEKELAAASPAAILTSTASHEPKAPDMQATRVAETEIPLIVQLAEENNGFGGSNNTMADPTVLGEVLISPHMSVKEVGSKHRA